MGYGAGLRACVHSLRRRHQKLPPIVVLRPAGQELTLADVDDVIPIDPEPYMSIPATGTYWGLEIYYKLEVFNLRGYERILYLDCDTLVLDDISALWDMRNYASKGLYAVREAADMGGHPAVVGKFNSGVMIINPPLLPENTFDRMIEIAGRAETYDGADQGIMNTFLEQESWASVGVLNPAYNVMVVIKKRGHWVRYKDGIKILHFTNYLKPWVPNHHQDPLYEPEFKRLWNEAYAVAPPRSEKVVLD